MSNKPPDKPQPASSASTEAQFARRVIIAAGISIALILAVIIAYVISWALFLFLFSILLAVVLRGITNFITRHTRLPDKVVLFLVIIFILSAIALSMWAIMPHIIQQIDELNVQLPRALDQAIGDMKKSPTGRWILKQTPSEEELRKNAGVMLKGATTFLTATTDFIIGLIVVVFGAFYLSYDPEMYIDGIVRLIPIRKRQRLKDVLDSVGYMLLWWMVGRFIDMFLISIFTGIGLWMIQIPLVLTLSILAGLLTFIPNFGPILSAIPALVLALPGGFDKVFYVIMLYIIIHAIEGYIISPIVQEKTALVPPVLTLVVQIGFGIIFGFLGLAMATPIVAAGLVFIKALYIEDVLGDQIDLIKIEAHGPPPAGIEH
jgi:predicted PurR-regulated permease PerM